jgi:hypothetical protein
MRARLTEAPPDFAQPMAEGPERLLAELQAVEEDDPD